MLNRKTVSQCPSADYCIGWNDAVDAMPKWISVKERLPEEIYSACLVYSGGYIQVADWSHDKMGWDVWFYVGGEYDPDVTHWMPLPSAPADDA